MTTHPHHRTDRTGPFAALLIALSMALAIVSLGSIQGTPSDADPAPLATPAPGFP
jgi:hypothetical protein